MSQDRKAKLKKRAQKQRQAKQRKHDLVEDALERSGLEQAFRSLPKVAQDFFRRDILPAPEVVIDPSAAACPETPEIKDLFYPILNSTPSLLNETVTAMQMYRFLCPLNNLLHQWEKEIQEQRLPIHKSPWPEIRAFTPIMRDYMQKHQNAVLAYFYSCWSYEMVKRAPVDERIFWFEGASRTTPSGKYVQQFVLHMTRPEQTKIIVDGASRPAFRCCLIDIPCGLKPLSFSSKELGLAGEERQYPVYIQAHVLEQLNRRIPKPSNMSFLMSLQHNKITRRPDDCFLVEYRHGLHKLGYFVGVRLADRVLLKTFLFLTMQGTPESDLLYHQLRLTRRDIEYMELDNLSAFIDTDLRDDPAIVKLFKECGCGHLLTEDLADSATDHRLGYAEGLKHYLGDFDAVTRRVEQAARAAQLRGGLTSPSAGQQTLDGLLAGLTGK